MKKKNRAAAYLGRLGGKARSRKLSKKRKIEIARLGGLAKQANLRKKQGGGG